MSQVLFDRKSARVKKAYGLRQDDMMSYREIGMELGVGATRARQMVKEAEEALASEPHWTDVLSRKLINVIKAYEHQHRDGRPFENAEEFHAELRKPGMVRAILKYREFGPKSFETMMDALGFDDIKPIGEKKAARFPHAACELHTLTYIVDELTDRGHPDAALIVASLVYNLKKLDRPGYENRGLPEPLATRIRRAIAFREDQIRRGIL